MADSYVVGENVTFVADGYIFKTGDEIPKRFFSDLAYVDRLMTENKIKVVNKAEKKLEKQIEKELKKEEKAESKEEKAEAKAEAKAEKESAKSESKKSKGNK